MEERVFVVKLEASGEVTPARPADAEQPELGTAEPEDAAESNEEAE